MAGINLEGRATLVAEKERAQVVSTLKDMLELSRQSAEENAKAREAAGITESLAEPFVRDTGDMVRPEMRPVDMVPSDLSDIIADESTAPLSEVDPAADIASDLQVIKQPDKDVTAPETSLRPQGRPKQETAPSSVEVELFDKVVGGESDDYDTVYYGSKVKPPKPVTQMTVEDIRSWQDASVKAGSKSSAVGRFQIIRKTMDSLINEGVLSPTDVFNEETQKKAYTALLDRRGYSKIKAQIKASSSLTEKKKLAENLQNNLAMEFASIPVATAIPKGKFGKWPKVDLVPGDTFYKDPKNPKLNKAQHKVEDFLNILTRL